MPAQKAVYVIIPSVIRCLKKLNDTLRISDLQSDEVLPIKYKSRPNKEYHMFQKKQNKLLRDCEECWEELSTPVVEINNPLVEQDDEADTSGDEEIPPKSWLDVKSLVQRWIQLCDINDSVATHYPCEYKNNHLFYLDPIELIFGQSVSSSICAK